MIMLNFPLSQREGSVPTDYIVAKLRIEYSGTKKISARDHAPIGATPPTLLLYIIEKNTEKVKLDEVVGPAASRGATYDVVAFLLLGRICSGNLLKVSANSGTLALSSGTGP